MRPSKNVVDFRGNAVQNFELIMAIEFFDDSVGIADVSGFSVGAAACNIRGNADLARLDVAVIFSEKPCTAAGAFTTNDVKAAPVYVSQAHLRGAAAGTPMHGIVATSGNANACTGEQGMKDANAMCELAAAACGVAPEQFFVCSTGRIGVNLPMEKMTRGIAEAAKNLAGTPEESLRAADAILTSDTRRKTCTAKFTVNGKTVTISGMAKGAGMIEPGMATMFGLLATDAEISQNLLQKCLWNAVGQSFNCVTVDGDMSTNDTVLVLANGESGVKISEEDAGTLALFKEALNAVTFGLARKIVGDGEKISRVVTLHIYGARTAADANKIARSIGNSLLVKASWCGGDPNWGRLLCSAGYAKCGIDQTKIDLFYNDVPVFLKGELQAQNEAAWRRVVGNKEFAIHMHLNLGVHDYRLISTDLTEAYVDFNKGE